MLIVGDKLIELIRITELAPIDSYDETCVQLCLNNTIARINLTSNQDYIVYGEEIPKKEIKFETIEEKLILNPKECLLASSAEEIRMPLGYAGFLQTKGTLARLMVSLHFSDGQVDPGFSGHITFEIFNASESRIAIPVNSPVGNLYILKTLGTAKPYHGKYSGSVFPTIQ